MTRADRQKIMRKGDGLLEMHRAGTLKSKPLLVNALANKWYRLNALYKIKDKDGMCCATAWAQANNMACSSGPQVEFCSNSARPPRY